jgi:hypothetical protein
VLGFAGTPLAGSRGLKSAFVGFGGGGSRHRAALSSVQPLAAVLAGMLAGAAVWTAAYSCPPGSAEPPRSLSCSQPSFGGGGGAIGGAGVAAGAVRRRSEFFCAKSTRGVAPTSGGQGTRGALVGLCLQWLARWSLCGTRGRAGEDWGRALKV